MLLVRRDVVSVAWLCKRQSCMRRKSCKALLHLKAFSKALSTTLQLMLVTFTSLRILLKSQRATVHFQPRSQAASTEL